MTDRILVERIAVFAYHGLLEEEARIGQRFYISLDCRIDLRPAGLSDDMAKTVSYADLTEIVVRIATTRRFALIEALAEAIAAEILERFEGVDSIVVRVDKPSAPVPAVIDGVAISILRSRAGLAR
ncbi:MULTISPECIES: dihydroneopterin aldolase [Methylobacterium]|uniref:7,8-dihydroneopterin aldolase n=1 Tax=Methylobacterium bullatum TaxID=570505 RepID=A0A679K7Z6_9HYPH|nr:MULTISPECIES: dihydroneopterin aldolase [Methylobacterium]KQO41516.1 dienelactone hydrolase [Methylobacterium sp. Leaf85]MBD8902302.1 dihydroneopterin aldolase [Methylobacterium bullatum]TXN24078.1 dihydroneopterin aldolase [Methylobacterium sp. WL19]CAA2144598.1 Dihydroneopterin aldolase [Methylobacterium bullatum]GJD39592.1 Dihydroneopterin aldolase [Methylobacterium bullatum]